MANRNEHKQEGGWGSWALIVFLFAIGIWPVALFLLFAKIFGDDNRQKRQAPPPLRTDAPGQTQYGGVEDTLGQVGQDVKNSYHQVQRDLRNSARNVRRDTQTESRAKAAAKNVVKSPSVKKSNARTLKIIGVIMTALGLYYAADPAGMVVAGYVSSYIWELLQYSAIAVGGVGMLLAGVRMDAAMRRYARYLAVMGAEPAVEVGQLARKLGYSKRRVEKDLQKMIDKDYFGDQAYLNVEMGYLFRSSQADADLRAQKAAKVAEPTPKEAEEGYSGILRNIRRANDRIADPVLTAKIDRLETITAKIFRAVEEDPKKAGRIDTFLNYYLPTTQKLLDAYAEFDAAGVEGENLRQAKQRIEKTMDSIVEGFEHQLDALYQSDAMDVDSDIRVMESMLHRDTASVERDFGLGGAPEAQDASAKATQTRDVDLGGMAAQKEE